jgi:hypothetical protein
MAIFIVVKAAQNRSDPRIWFLRIYDYGFGWLHIHELVNDLFYGFQGKFLKIFRR